MDSSSSPHSRAALFALLIGAACIGLAPIFPKLAVDLERTVQHAGTPLGLVATAFWRMAFAVPVIALLRMRSQRQEPALRRGDRLALWVPGITFALDMAAWHMSFEHTTLANSALLANLAIIIVSFVGVFALGERFSGGLLLGSVLALSGAGVLLGVDFTRGRDPLLGDGLAILTACFYAAYQLSVKQLRARFSTARIMAYSTSVSALGLLSIALISGEGLWPHTAAGWGWLVVLAMVSQLGGQGLITYAMAHLPVSFATVALLVQPLVAALASYVVFGQALSPLQLFGGLLVLLGVALAGRAARA